MYENQTVLVTGGSGYIASWCIVTLLKQGYTVRTTVRDLKREPEVRAAVATQVDPGHKLSFYVTNLLNDDGWENAINGCDYVLHVASPLGLPVPKNPDDLIRPARDGAVRVVATAIKSGVKRVVLTSSVAATRPPFASPDGISDETMWTNASDKRFEAYERSKAIAERAAWDLITASTGATTLTTVNPAFVLGPVLGKDFSDSLKIIQRLLAGRLRGIPRLGFCVVDVRDVAELHLYAMTRPEAAGERFIAAGDFVWIRDMAHMLRAHLGAAASRVPTRVIPDFVFRLASLFDHDLKAVTPRLGQRQIYSSVKADKTFGWKSRPMEDTILDCARSLIAAGIVSKT